MADFKYSLAGMPDDQRRCLQKLNKIFSPIPITVTEHELNIGFGDETEDCTVWRNIYRTYGHTAHCV